jgi:hypothetical protein
MRKAAMIGLVVILGFILVAPAWGGPGCGKSCAKSCGITTCPMKAKTDSLTASGHMCTPDGKCQCVTVNITGLKDAEGETNLTKALSETPGVLKVYAFDSKTGKASLCLDPEKIKADDLVKIIGAMGYKAEVDLSAAKTCDNKDKK